MSPRIPLPVLPHRMQALVFELGDGRFALPASDIERVVLPVAVEPLPGAPSVVEGVINVEGRVATVFDLRRRFILSDHSGRADGHFIVARVGPRLVVVRVDRASGMAEINEQAIEPIDTNGSAPGIGGIARTEDGVLLIHDPSAFLTQAEAGELDLALERWTSSSSHVRPS